MEIESMMVLSIFLLLLGILTGSFLHFAAIRLLQGEPTISEKSLSSQQRVRAMSLWWKLVTGLLFAWAGWMFGWESETIVALFMISILIVAVQTDLLKMIIPNQLIAIGIWFGIVLRLFIHDLPLWN